MPGALGLEITPASGRLSRCACWLTSPYCPTTASGGALTFTSRRWLNRAASHAGGRDEGPRTLPDGTMGNFSHSGSARSSTSGCFSRGAGGMELRLRLKTAAALAPVQCSAMARCCSNFDLPEEAKESDIVIRNSPASNNAQEAAAELRSRRGLCLGGRHRGTSPVRAERV